MGISGGRPESSEQREDTSAIRSGVESLARSSKRLEVATWALVALTIVLAVLTAVLIQRAH
jgi:hypothetical protein